jgi:hypothetical protein
LYYFLSRKSNENKALHENHRFRIAACFPLISQCYRMGLGAIPQAQRLNLGKFRGSRAGGLDDVLRSKNDISSGKMDIIQFNNN